MDHLISPGAQAVAIVVVITQLACGLAIAIGKPLRLALQWTVLLNMVFIMSGSVNPSAFYLVMEIVLLFAIADGTIGIHPTTPSRRTVVMAGFSAALALAVAPYIRTLDPSKVIDDPRGDAGLHRACHQCHPDGSPNFVSPRARDVHPGPVGHLGCRMDARQAEHGRARRVRALVHTPWPWLRAPATRHRTTGPAARSTATYRLTSVDGQQHAGDELGLIRSEKQ